MNTDHNRIKVADLEKNQPNKTLITNENGELEFSDVTGGSQDLQQTLSNGYTATNLPIHIYRTDGIFQDGFRQISPMHTTSLLDGSFRITSGITIDYNGQTLSKYDAAYHPNGIYYAENGWDDELGDQGKQNSLNTKRTTVGRCVYSFPEKPSGDYILATLEDISGEVIQKTKAEIDALISINALLPGSLYEISGVHPSLYNDSQSEKVIHGFSHQVGGTGYVIGIYDNVPLIGGTGSGLTIQINVGLAGGTGAWLVSIMNAGSGYSVGDTFTVDNSYLGGTGIGFQLKTMYDSDFQLIKHVWNGTTIYLQALTTNKLAKSGHGIFYNPKYNHEVDGFGIWSNTGTWETEQSNANILGNTGAAPFGICIDLDGNTYTANVTSSNVTKITPNGTSTIFGTSGGGGSICIDLDGNVYVANPSYSNITKITPDGTSTILYTTIGSCNRICIDLNGNIYTLVGNKVLKITPDGIGTTLYTATTSCSGICIDLDDNVYVIVDSVNVVKITPDGTDTILGITGDNPFNICVDLDGNVYTCNYGSNNVTKITPDGTSTILGNTNGSPINICVDLIGNVYTTNPSSSNINKITPDGTSTILVNTGGEPRSICTDLSNNVYIANSSSNNVTKVGEPIVFNENEMVTSNNGAIAQLIGGLENNKFIGISGNWSTSTFITGQTSGAVATISNIQILQPLINDKIIWGGYSWTNINGNIGTSINNLELDPNEWLKDVFTQENYNVVYDMIEYDYENDWISRRKEIKSGNDVTFNFDDNIHFNFGNSAISVFQFGNYYDSNEQIGIGNNTVFHAYNDNINFIGLFQSNLIFEPCSYQNNIIFNKGVYQNSLKFSTGSYQESITLGENSYQTNMKFGQNSLQNSIILKTGSSQKDIIFNFGAEHTLCEIPENLQMCNIKFEANIISNSNIYTADTNVFKNYQKTVFSRPDGTTKLRYYNDADELVITDITA